ncbi:MAG TPA: sugar ABC transporter ATP-binding protein [Vicinamibacterales bacterium]|nr:sugar ABC transporter ATP-binding protein [Vicinamibacterales bacterium]
MPGLEFHDLHKAFGAVRALDGVTFTVAAGEAHACVGENGAGKSTLLKILAGIVRPDRGAIRLDGDTLHFASPRDALSRGIGMVYQERLAFPNLTVAANIFAGRELVAAGGRLDEAAMRARTREILARLHLPIDPDVRMEHVSAAHAQLVQVARALAFDCRVLVLDEPTTSLTDAEVDHLFKVLFDLKARGVTLLFVSHRLPEVFRLCDRITVLRDGRFAGTFDRARTSADEIVRAMVGREPPERLERVPAARAAVPALEVRALTRRPWFDAVDVSVQAGEIVGIFGLVGSGRSELLQTIFGLARPDAGEMRLAGSAIAPTCALDAARAGLALVPEDRQQQGLFFNLDLRHNLAMPRAAKLGQARLDAVDERRAAERAVADLAIKTTSVQRMPDTLSGGNQQKTVAAKWLATGPSVLLLDEPTKGVDVGAKFEIHNIIRRQVAAGMACLMVSSDLPEVLALADRIVVMREGQVRGELAGAEATEEAVMQLATHEVEA